VTTWWSRVRNAYPGPRLNRGPESGYVAIMTALLMTVLMGLAGFAVDVGYWYLVGQREQSAADAAVMAGVTYLPANPTSANTTAMSYSGINGFTDGTCPGDATCPTPKVTVISALDGSPTKLRVTVSRKVTNFFGSLLGVPTTTVVRSAVADFAGPVPMGSPCNEYGNDPDPGSPTNRSTNCASAGSFWANVGSKAATKISGDAYQNDNCTSSPDGCTSAATSGANIDYDPNGYIYQILVTAPVTNLRIQLFDPSQVVVGDTCPTGGNARLEELSGRYAAGAGIWCTGDTAINGGTGIINTQFTLRSQGGNPWDPTSWPTQTACGTAGGNPRTFHGFNERLRDALNPSDGNYKPEVLETWRKWVDFCTISGTVQPGMYSLQVKTNGLGTDLVGAHNRFAIRAFGSGAADLDKVSVSGIDKMAMYGNTPSPSTTRFFLARVPSSSKGEILNVRLFDAGDGAASGSTIKVLPPADATSPATFTTCSGAGVVVGNLPSCQFSISSTTAFNGKFQSVAVSIPPTYACDDNLQKGCWVRLEFAYLSGSTPADTTTWKASIEGAPVRLIE
jgi:Flp pilus assembly protein TadG